MGKCGLILAVVMAACGGGASDGDAGTDAPAVDGAIDGGLASCVPITTLQGPPDSYAGSLDGAGSEFDVAVDSCAAVDAPFGVAARGPDEAIALRGLEPGTDYAIRLISSDDLAFYVATGCTAGEPPAVDGCLLFVDASTRRLEVGRFTAPGNGEAVVVIDHWEAEAPSDGDFTLELFAVQCTDDDDSACTGSTPVCADYRCVECDSSFDCTDPATPICEPLEDRCIAGSSQCDTDDTAENGDDGPAGARDITPSGASPTVTAGQICNAPVDEYDFYRFDVAQNGEHYTIELDWADSAVDLDIQLLDDRGNTYGLSLFERPEQIALTYLPAGRYYLQVNYAASSQISASADYTVTATRVTGDSCAGPADCAAEFRNQFFRSICDAGACSFRIGDGSLAEGALCDTSPDCQSGSCASFPFTATADTRSVCTRTCTSDADCTDLGFVCTTYLADNICVAPCTTDLECPVSFEFLPQSGPWFRLTCQPSGKCTF